MMKITGLSHLFKWENLHNWWLTKYFFAPLCICIYIYIYIIISHFFYKLYSIISLYFMVGKILLKLIKNYFFPP